MASPPSASVLFNRLQARLRIRHLQVFVKLGELRSLRRTAEAIQVSQPAVTQQLADLEQLLGLTLFERHARGVRPTVAGRELLPMARRMLDGLAQSCELVLNLRQQGAGVVRIAAIAGAVTGVLTQVVPAFSLAAPAVQVTILEMGIDACQLALARGDVDMVICRQPPTVPAGHVFLPLLHDPFVIACGVQHPLARQTQVPWALLERETWMLPPVDSVAREVFDQVMQHSAVMPQTCEVICRVASMTWAMLASRRLLTLVPYSVVGQLVAAGQLATLTPSPALPSSPLGLLFSEQELGVGTTAFVQHVLAHYGVPPWSPPAP